MMSHLYSEFVWTSNVQVKFHLSAAELSPKDNPGKAGQWKTKEGFGPPAMDPSNRQFPSCQGCSALVPTVLQTLKYLWPSLEYVVLCEWNFFCCSSRAWPHFSWCGRIHPPCGEKAPRPLQQLGRTGWLPLPSRSSKKTLSHYSHTSSCSQLLLRWQKYLYLPCKAASKLPLYWLSYVLLQFLFFFA